MFIDIYVPPPYKPGWFGRLVGRHETSFHAEHLERISHVMQTLPGVTGRLYRTAAGLRLLVTSETYDPASDLAQDIMNAFAVDAKYALLCRQQESFRARLTPKPWRCNQPSIPAKFPYETPMQAQAVARWAEKYTASTQNVAVCQFMQTMGDASILPQIAPIVQLHDQYVLKAPDMPLA